MKFGRLINFAGDLNNFNCNIEIPNVTEEDAGTWTRRISISYGKSMTPKIWRSMSKKIKHPQKRHHQQRQQKYQQHQQQQEPEKRLHQQRQQDYRQLVSV